MSNNKTFSGPDDPAIVEAVLERMEGLTREEWQARLAWTPEEEAPAPRRSRTKKRSPSPAATPAATTPPRR